ncbi:MAG TPA: hypothetical protein VGR67_09290 [Candidatus Polarisedimenticolia bacterium]|jgi:hypothetical protein|nr:hypothetical protein [Candidatus Polarisedimenticolia bacterium]
MTSRRRPPRRIPKSRAIVPLALLAGLLAAGAAASPSARVLVVCSPGSPGTTGDAQPTMDAFARAASRISGLQEGSLEAVYHETAEGGFERLSQPDAAFALVPPAFLARFGEELKLEPRLEAVSETGQPEVWSLVAHKGRLDSPAALAGWEVTGAPGFAPEFVRAVLFKGWGTLPGQARITFTSRVLSALRRAAVGEPVAVLLDTAGTASLATLPFRDDLVIAARSAPLPPAILCTVGKHPSPAPADALVKGLARLGESREGSEVLKSLRLSRFAPVKRELMPGRLDLPDKNKKKAAAKP